MLSANPIHHCAVNNNSNFEILGLLPPRTAKVMFSSLLDWLSVCLSVSSTTDRRVNGFHEMFRIDPAWHKGHSRAMSDRLFDAWSDYLTFLKPGAAEVCALGVFLVSTYLHSICIGIDPLLYVWHFRYLQHVYYHGFYNYVSDSDSDSVSVSSVSVLSVPFRTMSLLLYQLTFGMNNAKWILQICQSAMWSILIKKWIRLWLWVQMPHKTHYKNGRQRVFFNP